MTTRANADHPDLRKTNIDPNHWYPLARSREVSVGKTLPVAFAGEPIVLFRAQSGRVSALEDRCAHRQVPLHKGIVSGERLRCCYHGWTYDETGRCIGAPYAPKWKSGAPCVRAYPCREEYGLVFVFAGDAQRASSVPLPSIPRWNEPQWHTMYFSRRVGCHYTFMHENLMDMNHQCLHRGVVGRIRPTLLQTTSGEGWVEARYKFEQAGGRRHVAATLLRTRDPGGDHDLFCIRTEYPYQTLTLTRAGNSEPILHLWSVYVPLDREERTNHTFGLLSIRKPRIGWLLRFAEPLLRRFTEGIFAEDRMIVEAEQHAYDAQAGDWNQEVFPVILELRELLLRHGTREVDHGSQLPVARTTERLRSTA